MCWTLATSTKPSPPSLPLPSSASSACDMICVEPVRALVTTNREWKYFFFFFSGPYLYPSPMRRGI